MAVVVTKYGGSSVATPDHIKKVAQRLVARKNSGDQVITVVSAMGDTTDELTDLADAITDSPHNRELDMLLSTGEQVTIALLAMAVQELGCPAISFTGAQVGILTDEVHSKARIVSIDAARVKEALENDHIVIIAGFQGTTAVVSEPPRPSVVIWPSAVAIAAGIDADVCEINSDVAGVYTADPNVVKDARKLDRISYEEMLELAASGAGVLCMRSVEFARNHGVTIYCRSSFSDESGTIVTNEENDMEQAIVAAVTHDSSEAKITIRGVEDRPGIAATLFDALAEENVNVDMVIQNISEEGLTDISFTVPHADLERAQSAVNSVIEEIGARTWVLDEDVAKISIIGGGMRTHPGVTAKMFRALADADINIDLISTSPIRLSCIIALDDAERAVCVLHKAFGLEVTSAT
ncbi:MAG: aspartate kinase [Actinomycetia bacterium]|nr:aspartate kinase [Actinomycetes bacterium]